MMNEQMPTQADWEEDRIVARRCPMCGSSDIRGNDWVLGEDGEEYEIGCVCRDCGYDSGYFESENGTLKNNGVVDRPFIAPGEPGSHDKPEGYAD